MSIMNTIQGLDVFSIIYFIPSLYRKISFYKHKIILLRRRRTTLSDVGMILIQIGMHK